MDDETIPNTSAVNESLHASTDDGHNMNSMNAYKKALIIKEANFETKNDEVADDDSSFESVSGLDFDIAQEAPLESEEFILVEKGYIDPDPLPLGWSTIQHESGLKLYIYDKGRVCTTTRPYFLGAGSVRKHDIPRCAIPCLSYLYNPKDSIAEHLEIDATKQNIATCVQVENFTEVKFPTEETIESEFQITSQGVPENYILTSQYDDNRDVAMQEVFNEEDPFVVPVTDKIDSNEHILMAEGRDSWKVTHRVQDVRKHPDKTIDISELNNYCSKLFLFKKLRVMRFNSWSERREFSKRRKHFHQLHRTAPLQTKVIIKCPAQSKSGESNRKWLLNTTGKSHVCILHEYVQHSFRMQPKYSFSELENAATPYAATVTINDMKYGVGYGTSKKQAKSNAAKATLQILIPEMIRKPTDDNLCVTNTEKEDISSTTFFDTIGILDPRVADFCAKITEPLPFDLLKSCLNRNENLGEVTITCAGCGEDGELLKFTITVGPHQALVSCKNKREAKQQASQAILQKLHPHVNSWGALLRLYGSDGCMSFKEKLTQKSTEHSATLHVPKDVETPAPTPNTNEAILQRLRHKFSSFKAQGLCRKYEKRVPLQK